jgi:hypothetical protein
MPLNAFACVTDFFEEFTLLPCRIPHILNVYVSSEYTVFSFSGNIRTGDVAQG